MMTDSPIPNKYRRYRKDEAVSRAYLDGLMVGLFVMQGGEFDYGFGPRGLGSYVLDQNGKIVLFLPDY